MLYLACVASPCVIPIFLRNIGIWLFFNRGQVWIETLANYVFMALGTNGMWEWCKQEALLVFKKKETSVQKRQHRTGRKALREMYGIRSYSVMQILIGF